MNSSINLNLPTVISKSFVLTSGKCFETAARKSIYAVAGSSHHRLIILQSDSRRRVKNYQIHPEFERIEDKDRLEYRNNLALVELRQPFEFNETDVFPGCLIDRDFTIDGELLTTG